MSGRLVVFTGAGISADSGVSTFRDKGGLWAQHRVEQVCDITSWKQNFNLVHSFYSDRRSQMNEVEPNEAHYMIARLQARLGVRMQIITQNVDDLLERAGCRDVLHVHGNLTRMRCVACGENWDVGYRVWKPDEDRCPKCNSRKGVKPAVVFFGEDAPEYKRMYDHCYGLADGDVLLVMGTSGQVIPIGDIASMSPAITILSNLETQTEPSMPGAPVIEDRQFDVVHHGRAVDVAPLLERIVLDKLGEIS